MNSHLFFPWSTSYFHHFSSSKVVKIGQIFLINYFSHDVFFCKFSSKFHDWSTFKFHEFIVSVIKIHIFFRDVQRIIFPIFKYKKIANLNLDREVFFWIGNFSKPSIILHALIPVVQGHISDFMVSHLKEGTCKNLQKSKSKSICWVSTIF